MTAKGFAGEVAARIGAHVRKLRTAQQLTQRELAERMTPYVPRYFDRTHVTRLEKGTHLAGVDLLVAVARALDIEVSELLTCLDGARPEQSAEAAE